MSKNTFLDHLEELSTEVENLTYDNVVEWIEQNIIEVRNNNELVCTYGGSSIRIYIDSGVIKGLQGFSSRPIFVSVDTRVLEDLFSQF